ncbi:hypothetical protein FOXYS1_5006 [Fusarium oxysporum]|uniref:Cytochrome P450 n=1 Tax=Fusarium oxysporum TaxID=5507 RepID=A0A8H5AFX4_FUSOX|nr:hypothetical protein FOXYS1_5006 [Fusarium oxysporum]
MLLSLLSRWVWVSLLGAALVLVVLRSRRKTGKLPPGPPGTPLFGNLLDIPPHHSWLKFKAWADRYGPIMRLNLAGREHVVLSTEKVANDLLREKGSIYSSREHLVFASELLSNNLRPLLLPYNDTWRRGRKLMHQLTMPAAAESYEPVQDYQSKKLLVDLIGNPSGYEKHFVSYASGVVYRIGFGEFIETGDEPDLKRIVQVNHHLEQVASPGVYLVDSFPILKYLPYPIAPFKWEARRLHEEEISLFRQLQQNVRQGMITKKAPRSFTRTFLENQETFNLTDDEGAYVIGTLFEAGSGTTAAAMMSFSLAMCLHPEWQTRLYEELEAQVGDRMPDFSDIPNLPTVRAVVKEVLRWRPVTAGGVPHELVKDDAYKGYTFKAGTVFHPNQWAIHRDPELYPDPEAFDPDRWLSPDFPTTYREPLTKFPNLQNYSCFGFGRRICPGQNIAERSLNILVARIAWAVTYRKKKDENGAELPIPSYDYTVGFNVQPRFFHFDLIPRSPARTQQILDAYQTARKKREL